MPVSTEKDFQSKIEKLENWLASKEGPLKLTPHESSMASGFSNETFVFDIEKEDSEETLVLRLEPTEYQVFPNYDLPMQASIMKVLRGKNMLTPEVIYENDQTIEQTSGSASGSNASGPVGKKACQHALSCPGFTFIVATIAFW